MAGARPGGAIRRVDGAVSYRRRRRHKAARGRAWLGLLGVTALIFVAGGPVALAVPMLACLSWLLPRWASRARWLGPPTGMLPLLAFAGMTASGLLSAARPAGVGLLGTFGAARRMRTRRAGRRPVPGHAVPAPGRGGGAGKPGAWAGIGSALAVQRR